MLLINPYFGGYMFGIGDWSSWIPGSGGYERVPEEEAQLSAEEALIANEDGVEVEEEEETDDQSGIEGHKKHGKRVEATVKGVSLGAIANAVGGFVAKKVTNGALFCHHLYSASQ